MTEQIGGCLPFDRKHRSHATVYERAAWQHDIGQHEGSEFPYSYCPRCEMAHPLGRFAQEQAEAESLRSALRAVLYGVAGKDSSATSEGGTP